VDVEGHGALRLTQASAALLKGETTLTLRAEEQKAPRSRRESRGSTESAGDLPADAQARFEALRRWRSEAARTQGVPAYVIFHDATLRQIALAEPANLDALAEVQGVGAAKLERYGDAVLELLTSG
jgi:ATP-dependent DNA helicase RecQ